MEGNFSLSSTLPMDAEIYGEIYNETDDEIYNETYYGINDYNGSSTYFELTITVIFNVTVCFICVFCIFGLVGNGAVIWLLGFRMKRNPFTTYILNLAVADFGVLIFSISLALINIVVSLLPGNVDTFKPYVVSEGLFHCFYSTSQFLLTAISIDRCVAVLFPLWYRCHRPENLSTVLCVLVWLQSFLVQGSCFTFYITWAILARWITIPSMFYAFLVNSVVCLPLITVSTLILFIRFCFKSQQRRRKKLFMVILLTLFFFLIFAFPLNVIYLTSFKGTLSTDLRDTVIEFGFLCASLNSFVNPLLYFLVGRRKRGLHRENLKLILRRVFSEEEEEEACREEPETQL